PSDPFEILYFGENPFVADFEVGAPLGSPWTPGSLVPNPRGTWVSLNVTVNLQSLIDVTSVSEQNLLESNVQELTGDWLGYRFRSLFTPVTAPTGKAETQRLGSALFRREDCEGFLFTSARVSCYQNLA